MARFESIVGLLGPVAAIVAASSAFSQPVPPPAQDQDPAYVLGFTMDRIDGQEQPLDAYRGRVVMIVNVASRCGFTPQYEGLEKLYQDYRDRGFVVLGFPANDFGAQEPGTNAEIAEFCTARFGVSFPMFAKIAVTGDAAHPLYRKLASQPEPLGGPPRWNFTKFLVGRDGKVVARFGPRTAPDAPELIERVQRLLEQPAEAG